MENILNSDNCNLCPRRCNVNRKLNNVGFCNSTSTVKAALAGIHYFEEPSISGTKGSGTVFFSGCNMHCVFCQNFDISQENYGMEMTITDLANTFISQQKKGVHNLNLVSGGHYLPQIKEAIILAKRNGLSIPIVYNSNGYERVDALKELNGLIDIYLPDFKYFDNAYAIEYSETPNYFETASAAIIEMYKQVGKNIFDENGIMQKGVIIRHLVLPWLKEDSKKILLWIKNNFGDNTYVSLMSQYTPMYKALNIKSLNRRITSYEYNSVVDFFLEIGLSNGYMQERKSASVSYTPKFDLSGLEKE